MRVSHILCVLAGAAVVFTISIPGRAPAEAPRPQPASVPDPRVDAIAERFDRLEKALARIDELEAALERAERSVAEARSRQAAAAAVLEPPKTVSAKQRLDAYALTRDLDHAAEAIAAWKRIEDGTVDPAMRAEAAFEQGQIHLKLEDWSAAANEFRKVVELIGLGTPRGQTAAYQLGWCEAYCGDHRKAYEAFKRLCGSPNLLNTAAPTYRYQMASFATKFDPELAEREFERYVADYGDDPGPFASFVKHAREYLEKRRHTGAR